MVLNKDKLKEVAYSDTKAKALLNHLRLRERPRHEITVGRTVRILKDAGFTITRIEAEQILAKLADTGAGKLATGRNNRVVKLDWNKDLRDVACTALGLPRLSPEQVRKMRNREHMAEIPPLLEVAPLAERIVLKSDGVSIEVTGATNQESLKKLIQLLREG